MVAARCSPYAIWTSKPRPQYISKTYPRTGRNEWRVFVIWDPRDPEIEYIGCAPWKSTVRSSAGIHDAVEFWAGTDYETKYELQLIRADPCAVPHLCEATTAPELGGWEY